MTIFILIISILLNIVAGYVIYNMLKKAEKLEDAYMNMYNSFCYIRDNFEVGIKVIKAADIRGSFSSDDEVGSAFTNIKQTFEDLQKLTQIELDGKEKENGK